VVTLHSVCEGARDVSDAVTEHSASVVVVTEFADSVVVVTVFSG